MMSSPSTLGREETSRLKTLPLSRICSPMPSSTLALTGDRVYQNSFLSSLSGILTSTFSTQRGESTSMWMSMSMLMNRCAIIKFVIFHLKMKDNHQWQFTVGKLWWFSKKVELGELFWRASPLARNLTCGWAFPSGSWSFSLTHLTQPLATQPTQRKSSHADIFPSSSVSKLPWWSYCNDFQITYTESYYM